MYNRQGIAGVVGRFGYPHALSIERRLRYTPQQLYCSGCTERTFYLMAQDDGTLEAYCVKNNHKRVLVNVPELAQEVYAAIEAEIAAAIGGGSCEVGQPYIGTEEVQEETKADDTAIQHGASSKLDDPRRF